MARFNRLPRSLRFAIWLVIGIALPFASSRFRGIRNPQDVLIHDEMTYLVQADTFSRGRLTNPAPRHPEFFEAPYLLMEPTYQAKYPPAQALFLAIGQRFAGPPIWGVWLTCGLFAAALDWMLCGWVNRRWAMIGTAYAVAVLGITHSWATTYWGGMVAATGGALVLGGTRWTLRRWTSGRAVLTALGAVIVLNSRPYEGAVVCLACATVLAWWLVCGSTEARLKKTTAWCGPFLLVVALGGVAMGVYNKAVTGSWITPPYLLHPQQYDTCGMFRWQPINQVPKRHLTSRVGQFYEQDSLLNPGKPGGPQLGASAVVDEIRHGFLGLYQNFVSPMNLAPTDTVWLTPTVRYGLRAVLLAMILWFVCTSRRWGTLWAAWSVVILEVLAGGAVWWNLPHYHAPIVCLCYFLVVDSLRRVTVLSRRTWVPRAVHIRYVVLFLFLLIPARLLESQIETVFFPPAPVPAPAAATPQSVTPVPEALTRPQLLAFLSRQKRPVLAVFTYDAAVSLHEEWVYNSADLASQRVILAHDLGPQKLPLLIADFPGRDVWHVHVSPEGATVRLDGG